jgi:hypothetical protein
VVLVEDREVPKSRRRTLQVKAALPSCHCSRYVCHHILPLLIKRLTSFQPTVIAWLNFTLLFLRPFLMERP